MLKLSTRCESNYSSCTGRSSENTCSSSGGAQEKGNRGVKVWAMISQPVGTQKIKKPNCQFFPDTRLFFAKFQKPRTDNYFIMIFFL